MKEINYYAGGNTAKGFVHFFESNFQDLERLFILKGGPGTGKSTMIKSIGNEWRDKGYDLEWIHCSSDAKSLDAFIITELKIGIVDGTNPHALEPQYPGVVEEYVDLGVAWNREQLLKRKEEIIDLTKKVSKGFQTAYRSFREGLKEHDKLEEIYISQMDFNRANKLTSEWIQKLIQYPSKQGRGMTKHRFLGASTPIGPVDFVESITESLEIRYFIKGRAGTGKSTMLKKIVEVAKHNGYDIEVYHCGFDPDSLDMVVIRELNFAIFDSTEPHEYFPTREKDYIIDLYKETVATGTDEKYANRIRETTKKYKEKMNEGIQHLAKTKEIRDQLEEIYIEAMDFTIVNQIRDTINNEIKGMAQKNNS